MDLIPKKIIVGWRSNSLFQIHTNTLHQIEEELLTKHCNDIADKTGGKTYVVAGPNSKSLFESQGLKVLGNEDIDLTKYGGSAEEGKYWLMMREPCSSGEV
jgi:hypothetical protein